MNIREALIAQRPSLELQRAAQAEIARLDHQVKQLQTALAQMALNRDVPPITGDMSKE